MAEALGIVSSITGLVQNTATIVKYLQDVKNAPKERHDLLRELQYVDSYLSSAERQIRAATENDKWLAELKESKKPFDEFSDFLLELKERLEAGSSRWRRTFHRLRWTLTKESVEGDLKKIERFKTFLMIVIQHDHLTLSSAIKKSVDTILENTNRTKQTQIGALMTKPKKAVTWLSPLDFNAVLSAKLDERTSETGGWFLESQEFTEWKNSKAPSTLCCFGGPGVGKSILASTAVNHLHATSEGRKILVLCIFCDYKSAVAQTVPNFIRSLLKQVVQARRCLTPSIESLYDKHFLDALDELDGDGRREALVNALRALGEQIRLFVTSRYIPTTQSLLKADINLEIRRADDTDVEKYIKTRIKEPEGCLRAHLLKDEEGGGNLRQEIVKTVVEKADGMFLLARMHMNLLTGCMTRAQLNKELHALPTTLGLTYKFLLKRMDIQLRHLPKEVADHLQGLSAFDQKALAYRVFGWIAFAARPLNVSELQHALAIELGTKQLDLGNIIDEDILINLCAGFVVIDGNRDIRFVHYTTQEYFILHRDELFRNIHEKITRTCLTYMSFDTFDSLKGFNQWDFWKLEKNAFFEYSSRNWAYHARACGQNTVEQEILDFLRTRAEVARWYLSLDDKLYAKAKMPPTAAWFSAYYGLVHVMKILIAQRVNLQNENVLCIAAYAGHLDIVDMLLLRNDVDVNQVASESVGRLHSYTPLIAAASEGHEEIVKKLLQSKSMTSLNKLSPYWECTALSAAVRNNHTEVVKLLLSQPDIDTSIGFYNTPLIDASRFDHDEIVRVLLEWGKDDPNASGNDGMNALHDAVEYDNFNILRILMNSDRVDVNRTDLKGRTTLHSAVYWNELKFVELLLTHKGIDMMVKDGDGRSAYDIAVAKEYYEIAALLAEHGGKALGPHE
ncbi:uncharacterized protein EV420DRAFT_1646320 [Desarmillaria tabescens]|uniref:Ankyrin n=1 Tax=Armillaria tabescens TaxID=1929756 RepID=A0AA39K0L3_ARMTA|nr:uncharacterized protein EV420DRAFT_1646320 [Desarmillaria tabescens]KAK0451245.1 hypothetical protein EV420DRAFT_1646320 [Desarmillaria tabescens]